MTPLEIGPQETATLAALRAKAAEAPVDILHVVAAFKQQDAAAIRRHHEQMRAQTVTIPHGFEVTYTVEFNQPSGTMHHMSMSVRRIGRVPHPQGVLMVMAALGFVAKDFEGCAIWEEELADGRLAVNVVEPLAALPAVARKLN